MKDETLYRITYSFGLVLHMFGWSINSTMLREFERYGAKIEAIN